MRVERSAGAPMAPPLALSAPHVGTLSARVRRRLRRRYARRAMSVSVQLGLILAVLTALGSVAGFLYKFRGAREAPAVELRRPIHSTIALFRSPLYTLGILIALASWGLHVGALSLAPISLVQSVIAGGLVLLTVVADRLFGIEVTRREWIGVALTAAGLAFLAATFNGDALNGAHSHYDPATLAIYVAAVGAAGVVIATASRRATVLAVAAGLLWAASDTSIKALSSHLTISGIGVLVHPARVRDPDRVAARAARLGAQPPARRRGAGHRADERRGQPDDDRGRADRVRRAAARGTARARRAVARLRAGDRRRGADSASPRRRAARRRALRAKSPRPT